MENTVQLTLITLAIITHPTGHHGRTHWFTFMKEAT